MNPRAVQSERDRAEDRAEENEQVNDCEEEEIKEGSPERCSIEIQTDPPSVAASHISQAACSLRQELLPSPDIDLIKAAEQLVEMHKTVCARSEPNASHYDRGNSTATVTFVNAFFNPTLISKRTPIITTATRIATVKDVLQDWRRSFALFADWMQALPEMQLFDSNDQVTIAKNRFGPWYWWLLSNFSLEVGCDGVCYMNGSYYPRIPENQCLPDSRNVADKMLTTMVAPLIDLKIDETEKCIMFAIIIFSDEISELSCEGKETIRQVGTRFVRMMQNYIKSKNPSMNNAEIAVRIAKMMILLSAATNLVYMTSDNIQLNDVLHVVHWESFSDDIIQKSYKCF
ncbi:hypothetical protein WR25_16021 [Diploscapter pachys]|uniref:NR LBD domain-containing protein n=1 Tax=Diploscapter pachys TaxID=2018661 RepID=A0A2A2KNC8_9BILA|nr:hypothetical protein WR25_16021 [Diploscapter pachys]